MEDPGVKVCDTDRPGYSPSFQCLCLFLSETEDGTAATAHGKIGGLGLLLFLESDSGRGRGRGEESREEEKERGIDIDGAMLYHLSPGAGDD